MRITVIGVGHLGAVQAACMAAIGHEVLGVDADSRILPVLAAGRTFFFEPGLAELLGDMVRSGALRFSGSLADAADFADVHFICVGTPWHAGSQKADTSQVEAVIDGLAPLLRRDCLVVGKSTVPVGTARRMAGRLSRLSPRNVCAELAWNPEFVREGQAVQDTLWPQRLVAGVASARADALLRDLYAPHLARGVPLISTDLQTAELVKLAANAFLCMKISFINAMADLCDASGADVGELACAIGQDSRIGNGSLSAGLGFGGGCLPKDLQALLVSGAELGVTESLGLLREAQVINSARPSRVMRAARELAGGTLAERNVAVLGAAFKPGTDDVRDSPALAVAEALDAAGARVIVHDPAATASAAEAHPELRFTQDLEEACANAHLVMHLTDWPHYQQINPAALRRAVTWPVLLDARNALPLSQWRAAGWTAHGIGLRPSPHSSSRLRPQRTEPAESACRMRT